MADDRYRLDQLAAAAGVASTTVRLYQNRGLLDPPQLVGRTGYYGDDHLARLRLIARLQDEGHSLAGIRALLDSWRRGTGLGELVGAERQVHALIAGAQAVELSPTELAEHFPPEALTAPAMTRALQLGLVELTESGNVRVTDRRFMEAGAPLARLGIPVAVILDEWEALAHTMAGVAERFVSVFEAHLSPATSLTALDDAGGDGRAAIADQLATLRDAAARVVAAALDGALADAARRQLDALVSAAEPGAPVRRHAAARSGDATPARRRQQQQRADHQEHPGDDQQPRRRRARGR